MYIFPKFHLQHVHDVIGDVEREKERKNDT